MHVPRMRGPLGRVGRRRLGRCGLVLAALSCGPAGLAQEPADSPESILCGAMFRRNSGEPWFFHEIVSIERLAELPAGLGR